MFAADLVHEEISFLCVKRESGEKPELFPQL